MNDSILAAADIQRLEALHESLLDVCLHLELDGRTSDMIS